MKAKLVDDWREVVSHSFSFWLNVAGVLLLLVNMAGYIWFGINLDPYWVGWMALILLVGAMALRLLRQDGPRWRERLRVMVVVLLAGLAALAVTPRAFGATTEAQTMAIAVPFTGAHEGLRLTAYRPFAWDVPTICYGETQGVHMGMTATKVQCDAMLQQALSWRWARLRDYYQPHVIQSLLPASRDAAYLDVAYNCGVDAIGRSTAVRRLNASNVPGGCEALTWWNRGGGRVLIGLVHRRSDDYALCMRGG